MEWMNEWMINNWMDGRMNEQTDERMIEWMNGQIDGWMSEEMIEWTKVL